MTKPIDLTGQRFGRLSVIARDRNSSDGRARWMCQCDCGSICVVLGLSLRNGMTRSCGCLMRECQHGHFTHGKSYERIYQIWKGMRARCNHQLNRAYGDYGGRGICVCKEWDSSFRAFFAWAMESGYKDDLTIDRIDPDGNYEPENCRWADRTAQSRNRRNKRLLTYKGETRPLWEWAEITGLPDSLVSGRFARGWSAERIFSEPVHTECRNHRSKNN